MTDFERCIPYTYMPRARTTLAPARVHKGFAFAPQYRSSTRPGDARTFNTAAQQFCRHYGFQAPYLFDNDSDGDHIADSGRTGLRKREITEAMDASVGPLDVVAYFGHGSPRGLLSAGFIGEQGLNDFAEAVARNGSRRMVVILYACACGALGGFASQLYSALYRRGVVATIYAHDQPGHATNNPTKRRYPGGDYLIAPNSSRYRSWRDSLWNTNLWLRVPFLEAGRIESAF